MLKTALTTVFFLLLAFVNPNAAPAADKQDDKTKYETAIFAGGLFWAMAPPFKDVPGVIEVTSGYTGGKDKNPTFHDVSSGKSDHVEAVRVIYNPSRVSYAQLLDVFWKNIDPTDAEGQFSERGPQYRSVIFYLDDKQKALAESSREKMGSSGKFDKPIVTEIVKASKFYDAGGPYQDLDKVNSKRTRFTIMKSISVRERFLEQIWGRERK